MHVAITFDLKEQYERNGFTSEDLAELDIPETIDSIAQFLTKQNHTVQRVCGLFDLISELQKGTRWDLVFNIAEGVYGSAREAQIPSLLEAHRIPFVFSDALTLALTLDKGLTKRVLREQGFATPDFVVVDTPNKLDRVSDVLNFPLFVKPVAEGSSKGIDVHSLAKNQEELRQKVNSIWTSFQQAALVETYLPGREFTVGVLGTGSEARVIGVMEVIFNNSADAPGYTLKNKQNYLERVRYTIAKDKEANEAGRLALTVWQTLKCRDGGRLDIRSNAEKIPHFLEVNPLPGLHPIHSDIVILSKLVGMSYEELLGFIFDSALQRCTRSSFNPFLVQKIRS